jgi:hypothetical protein
VGVGTWTFSATNLKPLSVSSRSLSALAVASHAWLSNTTYPASHGRGSSSLFHASLTTAVREAAVEAVRPAAQPEASSPERVAAARGGAHRLDQPSEGLAPSQRKADRTSELRSLNVRRLLSRWSL